LPTRRFRANEGSYAIAKTALEAAGRQMALELGPHNIRVNTAVMGWMWGASVEGHMNHMAEQQGVPVQNLIDGVAAQIPLRRIPPDEECARSILFLLSDLSSVVTGASINVNGGEHMG
jgi:NAD(P)-dependent dehydrogenase (short-subunit alcohol dehydrogenase family)